MSSPVLVPQVSRANSPLMTDAGRRILDSAQSWASRQWGERQRYAVKATCAVNMTRVFKDAGYPQYKGEAVVAFFNSLQNEIKRTHWGRVVRLPKGNPAAAGRELAKLYGGSLPPGTLILGCTDPTCTQYGPNEHIAVVGETRGNVIDAWHNNWLRNENYGPSLRKTMGKYMISVEHEKTGYLRQWMATPWLKVTSGSGGPVAKAVIPYIDDLDPNQFNVILVVPPEIDRELREGAPGRR